jgi:hypothetical protein
MLACGLTNVRLEPCTVPRWERGEVEELLLCAGAGAASEALPVLALGGSVATPAEGIEAEVVEVQSFEELRALGEAVRGRMVLFNRAMDDAQRNPFAAYGGAVGQRSRGAIEAARLGAVAAIVRSVTTRLDDVPHTGSMRYADDVPRIPAVAVSTLGAERISALLRAGESPRLRLRLACRWLDEVESSNVVGELVGREKPEEVLVLAAHLDAWDVGQGAHDDGAGCAQVLEAARLLEVLDLRPRRTIRVVLYMNEEFGMSGALAYVDEHREELERHVLALESDRGGFVPRGFTSNANQEALAILREAAAPLAEIGAAPVVPGGGGVDIGPLGPSGVVLVGYLPDPQRYFDVHHSPADTLDSVHPRELALGAAAIAALVHHVAELPETLPRNE